MREHDNEWGRYRRIARDQPMIDASRELELLGRAKQGDRRAADVLVQSHLRLVVQVASRYARDGLAVHDLVGEGVLGLLEAIQRFDVGHGARFASYAGFWVRAQVQAYALANRRMVAVPSTRGARVARARLRKTERALTQQLGRKPTHRETAHALGVSEQDVALVDVALSARDESLTPVDEGSPFEPPGSELDPEQTFADREELEMRARSLRRALAQLNEREQSVVREQFLADEGHSLADCGRRLGVSRQRAGQILGAARDKLRAELEPAQLAWA